MSKCVCFKHCALRARLPRVLLHVVLVFWAVFMILPFLWMVLSSLKTSAETTQMPIQWMPSVPKWENYGELIANHGIVRYYINTILVTVCTVSVQLFLSVMAAYAFARLYFPFKNLVFFLCLCVIMVPTQMMIIPRFLLMIRLKWVNTFAGLIVPNLPSIYSVFFLRQNFMAIPRELDESAIIDGCSFFGVFFHILLPLVKNGVIGLTVISVLWCWNEMLWPLIVVHSEKMYVLSIAISNLQGQYSNNLPLVMAAGVVSVVPMVLVFLLGQESLIEGIALSGLKS